MCCAICVGISVAIAAGIAYGYNYMLAEFLTTGRQDLSVYVRRGQFHDRPDFGQGFRRRGDENDSRIDHRTYSRSVLILSNGDLKPEDSYVGHSSLNDIVMIAKDETGFASGNVLKHLYPVVDFDDFILLDETVFSSNASDYQDTKIESDSKLLSDTWRKALDTRKYADKLTKYSYGQFGANFNGSRISDLAGRGDAYATGPPPSRSVIRRVYSVTPNPAMSSPILPEQADIVLWNYKPNEIMTVSPESKAMDGEFYEESNRASMEVTSKQKESIPDIKISLKELPKSKYVPMRTPAKSAHSDYPAEEVDEDNIVYKPV